MLTARNISHREWFLAALSIFGILLAGSDAQWFPVPNLVEVTLIGLGSLWRKWKVENMETREVLFSEGRIFDRERISHPIRPEPEFALGLWKTCQVTEEDLRRIMWAGSNAGDGTRQVAHLGGEIRIWPRLRNLDLNSLRILNTSLVSCFLVLMSVG